LAHLSIVDVTEEELCFYDERDINVRGLIALNESSPQIFSHDDDNRLSIDLSEVTVDIDLDEFEDEWSIMFFGIVDGTTKYFEVLAKHLY